MYSLTHPLTPHLPGRVTPKQMDEGTRILAKSLYMGLSWWPLQIISKLSPRSYLLFPWFIQCRIRAMQTDRKSLVSKAMSRADGCAGHLLFVSSITVLPPHPLTVSQDPDAGVFVCFVFELEYWEAPVWSWGKRRGWSHWFVSLPQVSLPGPGTSCIPWLP